MVVREEESGAQWGSEKREKENLFFVFYFIGELEME